jgi:UPF0716 protein FxsA
MPGESLLDAVLIFVAGLLLITPGVLTDLLGLTLLIPPCRASYRRRLLAWLRSRFVVHTVPGASWPSAGGRSQVIDVEAVEVHDREKDVPLER